MSENPHSGDLVSNVDISSLRCLGHNSGKIVLYQFKPKDVFMIDHHIRTTRGNILFARCWLLVEGKTERLVFERCASICGLDLTREGIYCVEYAQIGNPGTLIKFIKQLGIEWYIVADGDGQGDSYIKHAKKECGKDEKEHIHQLDYTFDVLLCMAGYGHHYQKYDNKPSSQASIKNADYWRDIVGRMNSRAKTDAAAAAIEEMRTKGVPEAIGQIITKSIHLARGD